jgi:hypothetical protein
VLRCMVISGIIGIATELNARALRLWIYRSPWIRIINVLVMFGMVMGAIASLVPTFGLVAGFLIAFGIGLSYEIVNLNFFRWWRFPDERLGFVRGHTAIVVVIAILWGIVPLMTLAIETALF